MSEKSNFWTQVISTMNAVVKFGSISPDNNLLKHLEWLEMMQDIIS